MNRDVRHSPRNLVPHADCPTCEGSGEKLPVVIRNCAFVDITCPECDGSGTTEQLTRQDLLELCEILASARNNAVGAPRRNRIDRILNKVRRAHAEQSKAYYG